MNSINNKIRTINNERDENGISIYNDANGTVDRIQFISQEPILYPTLL